MTTSARNIAEKIDALSERYRADEFSEDVMRASLKYKLPPDETEILIRTINEQKARK